MNISKEKKRSIVEKICDNTIFSTAGQYKNLLMYLYQCSEDGYIPTEFDIATKVLKKADDFDPSVDTSVRVYIYKLRKKLDGYYKANGKNDKIRIEIPKGHYGVKFSEYNKKDKFKIFAKLKRKDIIYISVIVLASIFTFLISSSLFISTFDNKLSDNDPIWSSFFNNQLPTTLLIGDHFNYFEIDKELDRERLLTDYGIKSDEEFNELKNTFPNRTFRKQDHGSLPDNSIFNLHDLENVFFSFNRKPEIQLTTGFMQDKYDISKIVDRNIVYIGGFKNLRHFGTILNKLPIEINYTENWKGKIEVKNNIGDSLVSFQSKEIKAGEYFLDLGLIAKIPGGKEENYMIISGFAFPAQMETVKMISRPDLLTKIYGDSLVTKKEFPEYFFMVLEFLGAEYSAMESKVVYFQEIKK